MGKKTTKIGGVLRAVLTVAIGQREGDGGMAPFIKLLLRDGMMEIGGGL